MSSKVLRPDDAPVVEALLWRPVYPAGAQLDARRGPVEEAKHLEGMRQMQDSAREAHAQGYREGEAAGRTQGQSDVLPVVERLGRTIEEISNLRSRLRREAEADTIQLALAIARRVLRRQLAVDPEALHGLVLAALEKLEGQEVSRVRVHPSHAGIIATLLEHRNGGTKVEVTADASREPGTILFETQRGNLDASIDSQLQEIERGLAYCLRRQS